MRDATGALFRVHPHGFRLAEYRGKVVDITGKVVEGTGPSISSDALWLKRNILAQALPNGACRLPIQQGECPHANACLTCVHFGTSSKYLAVLKEQLAQTDRILETAQAQGWTRQTEMNQRVRDNLLTVITALETDDQAVVVGGRLPTQPPATFVPLDQL